MRLTNEFRTKAMNDRRAFIESTPAQALSDLYQLMAGHFFSAVSSHAFSGQNVILTRPRQDEIKLDAFIERLLEQGAHLYFPKIKDAATSTMEFFRVEDPSTHPWNLGAFGIQEPASGDRLDPLKLHWAFVPGAAFGEHGERIGLGRGFFDRYLARAPQARRVALAFDFQVFESLPQETWDLRMDWLVTPQGVKRFPTR